MRSSWPSPRIPAQLLPPATDEASDLLLNLLYDPLYRLDERLVPHPRLAAALPTVSEDGLTWTIELAPGDLRFTDGDPVTAADVVTTLQDRQLPEPAAWVGSCARPPMDVIDSARGPERPPGPAHPHPALCPVPGGSPRPAAHPRRHGGPGGRRDHRAGRLGDSR